MFTRLFGVFFRDFLKVAGAVLGVSGYAGGANTQALVGALLTIAGIALSSFKEYLAHRVATGQPPLTITLGSQKVSAYLACALLVSLQLSGCANSASTTASLVTVDGCQTTAVALEALAALRTAGKLSAAQIATVSADEALLDPFCSAPTAGAALSAAQSAAVTELLQLAASVS